MRIITSFAYNKDVFHSFEEKFSVPETGLYAIEITAVAKSWWQNTVDRRSFLLKDSLTVRLDGRDFIFSPKKKKIRADDFWNGNILKGGELAIYLFARLEAAHTLSFDVHGKPFVKSIVVHQLENRIFTLKHQSTQRRDRAPWVMFLFAESLSAASLFITARAGKKQSADDDDLSLRIDGTFVRNEEKRAHKDWYWCGKILNGKKKTFAREFDDEEAPIRIEIRADETPVIDEVAMKIKRKPFTEEDVKQYVYKGQKGNEDYNRFNNEILYAVNRWNQEFDDAYPPSEPLHPNLVKAMIYIESRMGYFESRGYPSYPDVMQVANADNPGIHTLNRDGWIDPKTKMIAEENEWRDGTIAPLDYHGQANGASHKESILWGTRWLYHLAQGITHDGTRYWRSWKEAVRIYNGGGNPHYVQEVYNVYQHGIDRRKNTIKLWIMGLFFALTLLGGGLGVYAYEQNGYFWLSFDETQQEGAEYVLVLNEIRGIITRKTPIATHYSNGQNFYDIKKNDEVTFHGHDINYDGEPEIVITGRSEYALTVYVLQNVNGAWTIIPRIGDPLGSSYSAPAFYGHDVNFANTDGKGWKEAKESYYIPSTNAQGEVWHRWYRYNPTLRAFVFMEQNIEKVRDGVDPFDETYGDSIMMEKSPDFTW